MLKNAEWIFVDNIQQDVCNSYFDYKANFETKGKGKVKLYLSSCSLYALYINGQFVDCGQYPGYEDYQIYDVIDITSYTVDGVNSLFLTQYVVGEDFSTHRVLIPGVIFSVWQNDNCILNSSAECLSRVNPYYLCGDMERVSLQLGYTFKYDARQKETPFQASVVAKKEKHLYERPISKLPIEKEITGILKNQGVFIETKSDKPIGKRMQDSFLASRTTQELFSAEQQELCWQISEQNAEGVYFIFDAKEESVGFISLDFEVEEECEVLIGYGEHLEDLRVRSFVADRNFCGSYYATKGRNKFFYPFQRMGMRYLQVHVYSKCGILHHAGIRKTFYPVKEKECNSHDPLYRKIHEVGIRTLQLCMHEHYEDCPWREQSLYAYDSRIQMLCGYYAFEEYEFAKASIYLMAHSLRKDGTIELCSPGKVAITIPSFTAVFIRQAKEYLEHSKDRAFIEEIFGSLTKVIEEFEKRIIKYDLLPYFEGDEYWNFYEWSEGLSGKEYFYEDARFEAPLNALVADAFYCYARICDVVAPNIAIHYDNLYVRMKKAIHQHFYDEERGIYVTHKGDEKDRKVHAYTQALMLYIGVVPQEKKERVIENLLNGDMVPCTLSSSIYLYDALLREGNKYRTFVKEQVEQRWGKMLFAGATTFWETDKGQSDFRNAGSLCHGWSAVPIYLQMAYQLW